ncbi:MAG: ABC transporter substrate-binding protein [Eubacteriales bacterium]|nr:ABC transporter substrate-binding protein [Eubacteriales bacterium]
MKKTLSFILTLSLCFTLAACGNDTNKPAKEEETTLAKEEVTEAPKKTEAEATTEASTETEAEAEAEEETSDKEAAVDDKKETAADKYQLKDGIVREASIDDYNFELTEEEQKAMEKEPMYGKAIHYWIADGCTSGPAVADLLGYYEDAGLKAEGVRGNSYTEALGTRATDVAVGHIATMLVPCTNGVKLTFTGAAHVGCKSLYVLADSDYQSTSDLKGKVISTPNGIGASDYNITCMMFDADGINPLTEVELTPVETSACVAAMERGEIAAALLSDTFAYHMVQDGKLRVVRSLTWDEDFQKLPCCIVAMSEEFVEENPVHAKLVTECVKKAHCWMRENPEEATQLLIDEGLNSEDFDMNVELNQSLHFGLTDEFGLEGLKHIANKYIKLGLITSTDNLDEVIDKAWTDVDDAK